MKKKPFRFGVALPRIRRHLKQLGVADAAMFALAKQGHSSVFEQLVACVLSIRTMDEVMLPTALALFESAPTPAALAKMSVAAIDERIRASAFHRAKAEQIREIARVTVERFGGKLPCDAETLMEFKGVGPKCANLAVGVACGARRIGVDVHVHRITNRWGVVRAPAPERTMTALEKILPRRYWIEINQLLVPFGKHVCTGQRPKCSRCPVLDMCRQVGVMSHR
jgi:endonuclease III